MRRDVSVSAMACFGVMAGVTVLLAVAVADVCLMRDDGPPVPGVVVGQGFAPGQTSVGTVTDSNGRTGLTVSQSEDVYTVVVRTVDCKEVVKVRRRTWERLTDGQAVGVRHLVSPVFGFRESRLAD